MKKILLLVLIFMLCACTEKENTETIEPTDVKETVAYEENKVINHIDVDKKETVYANADAYGNVEKIEVEVILRSDDKDYIEDISNLENIKNTYSDETFTFNDDKLVFENKGEDIHYKGNSNSKLPVNVSVTYYLDEKEINADDLAGKSGKLKIRFDYQNNTIRNVEGFNVLDPFMAISMIMLDEDVFSNVKIENGKLLEYGENKIALIYGAPGISESLRLSGYELTKDIKVPDYGELTADVNNFKLDYTATIITNGLFTDVEDDDLKDIYDMNKDMNEFKDSSSELKDNTSKLYDACVTLDDALDKYTAGVNTINTNMAKILEGSKTMNDSLKTLSESVEEYDSESLSELILAMNQQFETIINTINSNNTNIETINNEIDVIIGKVVSLESVSDSEKKEIIGLLNTHKDNVAKIESINIEQLSQSFATINQMFNTLSGLLAMPETFKQLSDGMNTLNTSLQAIKNGTASLASANKDINDGLGELVDAAKEFDDGMKDFVDNDLNDIMKLADSSLTTIADRVKVLRKLDNEYGCFSGLMDGKKGNTVFLIETEEIK